MAKKKKKAKPKAAASATAVDAPQLQDRIKSLRRMRAGDLVPHPKNWRKHPKAQREALDAVQREVGIAGAVLAFELDDGRLQLIDGHLRQDMDPEQKLPVLVLDVNEEEAEKILATYDPLAAMANADDELLAALLTDIEAGDDVDRLLQKIAADAGLELDDVNGQLIDDATIIDKAADLQKKWKTKPGQLWEITGKAQHRLICGDATDGGQVEQLTGGETMQMMFADPPYGVDYEGGHHTLTGQKPREKIRGDDAPELYARFLPVLLPIVAGPCYVWFAALRAAEIYAAVTTAECDLHALIIWHKTNATYAAMRSQYKQRHEPCLYFKPKGATLRWCGPTNECTVWELPRDARNDLHPMQKPVALAARAIKNHKAETVIDPFVGSGSTMAAAEQLGRRCFGIEIEPKYIAVTLERMTALNCTCKKVEG